MDLLSENLWYYLCLFDESGNIRCTTSKASLGLFRLFSEKFFDTLSISWTNQADFDTGLPLMLQRPNIQKRIRHFVVQPSDDGGGIDSTLWDLVISPEQMDSLLAFKNLQEFCYGNMTAPLLRKLAQFTNLRILDISSSADLMNFEWDTSPLSHLTNLETLNLAGLSCSRNALAPIQHLTKMKCLDIRSTAINNDQLRFLANMIQLEKLNLSCNSRITDISHLSGLTTLTELHLERCWFRDGNGLGILKDFTNLTSLNLAQTYLMNDNAAITFFQLPNLKILNLESSSVNVNHISHLTSFSPLKDLNLSFNIFLEDSDIETVANCFPRLERFNFTACRSLTPDCLQFLNRFECLIDCMTSLTDPNRHPESAAVEPA